MGHKDVVKENSILPGGLGDINERLSVVKQDTKNPDSYIDRVKLEGDISNTEKALNTARGEYQNLIASSEDEVLALYESIRSEMENEVYQKRTPLNKEITSKISELDELFRQRTNYYNRSTVQFNKAIKDHLDETPKFGPYGSQLIQSWVFTTEYDKVNKELIHLKGYVGK